MFEANAGPRSTNPTCIFAIRHGGSSSSATIRDQSLAPPEAALAAGFSSTTRRNRRELDTLQNALCGSLELNHIVLDYQQSIKKDPATQQVIKGESEIAQPLSWHLTKREQHRINGGHTTDSSLDRKKPVSDRQKIEEAVAWFREAQSKKDEDQGIPCVQRAIACEAAMRSSALGGEPATMKWVYG